VTDAGGSQTEHREEGVSRPDEGSGRPHAGESRLDAAASRLPELGRRGEGWVALQVVLIGVIAATGMFGPRWGGARRWRALPAGISALTGMYLFVAGAAGLGRQLTPFPKPVEQSSLKQGGAYRLVRHPIYGGVLLLGLAWSLASSPAALLPWAAAGAFLDAKRRREEAWLIEKHPEYEDYKRSVRASFLPFIW
jgi:protein-S-isoprenylcysteine O-methyltransferase Ste14